MDNQLCFLEKFYLYYIDTSKTYKWHSNTRVRTELVYAAVNTPGIIELNLVRLDDGTVEYVEQFADGFHVYKEMPKHWLVRVLLAVETD